MSVQIMTNYEVISEKQRRKRDVTLRVEIRVDGWTCEARDIDMIGFFFNDDCNLSLTLTKPFSKVVLHFVPG